MTIKRVKRIAEAAAIAWAVAMLACTAAYAVTQLTVTHVIISEPPHRVGAGETVWTIANKIAARHADKPINVGALAYAIETENGIQNSVIKPGQVLNIPDHISF